MRRLLVVDDEVFIARAIQRLVGRSFEVLSAGSLESARRILARPERISAAIVDIALPDGLGLQLVVEIRASERADMPVLILTASTEPVYINAAQSLGASYAVKLDIALSLYPFIRRLGDEDETPGAVTWQERLEPFATTRGLTQRHTELLAAACEYPFESNKQLAVRLGISENTLRQHIKAILACCSESSLKDLVTKLLGRSHAAHPPGRGSGTMRIASESSETTKAPLRGRRRLV